MGAELHIILVYKIKRGGNHERGACSGKTTGKEKRLSLARKGDFTLSNREEVEFDRRRGTFSCSGGSSGKLDTDMRVAGRDSDSDSVGVESKDSEPTELRSERVVEGCMGIGCPVCGSVKRRNRRCIGVTPDGADIESG